MPLRTFFGTSGLVMLLAVLLAAVGCSPASGSLGTALSTPTATAGQPRSSHPSPGATPAIASPTALPSPSGSTFRSPLPTIEPTATLEDATSTSPLPTPQQSPAVSPRGLAIAAAREDLAHRLGVNPEEIEVIGAYADDFPVGDLGCPPPGKAPDPRPAFVTGLEIVLDVEGDRYVYHARGRKVVFCGKRG